MPRMSAEDFEPYLHNPLTGVIATLRQDGTPYTVPVWWLWRPLESQATGEFGYPQGEIWMTGTYSRVWCKQLVHDGRASLCIESTVDPFTAHVEFDGVCTAFERPGFDIWPISRLLAEKYVGRNDPANADAVDRFFANMQTEPRLLFRLLPSTTRAIDLRVYRGKRADREYQSRQRPDSAG